MDRTMTAASDATWRHRLYEFIGSLPADPIVCLSYLLATDVVLLSETPLSPLRPVVGLPILLFLPGYVLLLLFFPRSRPAESIDADSRRSSTRLAGIDRVERLALSFGASVVLMPFVGLGMGLFGLPFGTAAIAQVVTALVAVLAVGAAVRQLSVPVDERFSLVRSGSSGRFWKRLVAEPTTAEATLNVLLAALVLVSLATLGFGVLASDTGETYTQLEVATESLSGDYVADGYPDTLERGESRPLVVGVHNEERERMNYTVVAQMQRVELSDGDVTVTERRRLHAFRFRVADGESVYREHSVAPRMVGEDLRLVYLLYRDEPPASPRIDNAYRHTFVWMNVTAPRQSPTTESPR